LQELRVKPFCPRKIIRSFRPLGLTQERGSVPLGKDIPQAIAACPNHSQNDQSPNQQRSIQAILRWTNKFSSGSGT
jgi:hypothetical protein